MMNLFTANKTKSLAICSLTCCLLQGCLKIFLLKKQGTTGETRTSFFIQICILAFVFIEAVFIQHTFAIKCVLSMWRVIKTPETTLL